MVRWFNPIEPREIELMTSSKKGRPKKTCGGQSQVPKTKRTVAKSSATSKSATALHLGRSSRGGERSVEASVSPQRRFDLRDFLSKVGLPVVLVCLLAVMIVPESKIQSVTALVVAVREFLK